MRELTIGEFALQTGITQRALRLYDERGILVPAAVDPFNGYRRYSPSQVRTGHLVKALREAGVPMAELVDLDAFSVAEHRQRLQLRRDAEDQALALAEVIDGFDPGDWPVTERAAEPQAWVGMTVAIGVPDDASSDEALAELEDVEAANSCFGAMFTWLADHSARPNGSWWTAMGEGREAGSIALSLCWPIPRELAVGELAELGTATRKAVSAPLADRMSAVSGVLPRRRELACRADLPEGDAEPAALMAAGLGPALALEAYESEHCLSAIGRTLRQVGSDGTAHELVLDVTP
ncbi:MerR family DNA-binding transcriptional regulator [Naumannella sp. ID2617S]|uniref:HTH merR-type domain-containing protein n=1 Tax=Enemella dayhoffiae TaxID=2016507 RepID=A0A255GUB8_9ACTN|nr:MerR family transcriptional regulator [Enemella dayhoffiae]NNG18974.1 MerR family DNA-binding transcriptional regulator [Naumannella sp. ID2617S]OYO19285.1 hypothetical protein CGZ93_12945 [Enemella dayhoffiae]